MFHTENVWLHLFLLRLLPPIRYMHGHTVSDMLGNCIPNTSVYFVVCHRQGSVIVGFTLLLESSFFGKGAWEDVLAELAFTLGGYQVDLSSITLSSMYIIFLRIRLFPNYAHQVVTILVILSYPSLYTHVSFIS